MSSLEDQLNEDFAPGWRPEPGDAVMGVVVDVSMRERQDFGQGTTPYPIVTLSQDDGTRVAVHAFHFVLEGELRKIKPQIGHRIGIKYLGKPEGKRYEVYRVVTDHPPQVEWGGGASVSPDPPESLNPNGTFAPGYGTLPPGTEAFTPQEPPPANPGAAKDESIPF
jgi:hypothetical protein